MGKDYRGHRDSRCVEELGKQGDDAIDSVRLDVRRACRGWECYCVRVSRGLRRWLLTVAARRVRKAIVSIGAFK